MLDTTNIDLSWKPLFRDQMQLPYFDRIKHGLVNDRENGISIYPEDSIVFNAYNRTSLNDVKVVILGQDPYHNPGEAMGLSFSVPKGIKVPPSLKNIYKELLTDLGLPISNSGDLSGWADQGVLLLNAFLTVKHKEPGSHRKLGWGDFTDATIQYISDKKEHVVFMLWGNFAKSKADLIDSDKHLILEAAHPSPLARGAYFGSKHFSKSNNYLSSHHLNKIDWEIENHTQPDLFSQ